MNPRTTRHWVCILSAVWLAAESFSVAPAAEAKGNAGKASAAKASEKNTPAKTQAKAEAQAKAQAAKKTAAKSKVPALGNKQGAHRRNNHRKHKGNKGGNKPNAGRSDSGGGGLTPAPDRPSLAAPESSVTRTGDGETAAARARAAGLQAERMHAESEQAFLRELKDHLPVGLWSADRVIDENEGTTLLHYAAMQDWPEAVAYLLEQGANPESRNCLGKTPAILARELGYGDVLRIFEEAAVKRASAASSN